MRIIHTDEPLPKGVTEGLWVYNGLDCCVTLEVLHEIKPLLDEITRPVYERALELQAPILEMQCRGVRVDRDARDKVLGEFLEQRERLIENFNRIIEDGIGIERINPNSPAQLKHLLYEVLALPPVRKRNTKGQYTVTTGREALEKLQSYFFAETIIKHILTIRDLGKKIGMLRTGIDEDGRIRTSFNIGGTDTGRLSSYASSFGTGTNMQNITGRLRNVFEADPEMRMAYIDLEQAEARAVGAILWNRFHDGKYLDFCESGDLHTNVAKMTFKHLPWTGDPKKDKDIAKQPFYREFSYRDSTKRLGHGTNYRGKPPHMSKVLRVPVPLITEFQREYFLAFPALVEWHKWVASTLIRDGYITTFMGRRRYFTGRRYDDETVRAAVAYEPQSAVADYLNRGLMEVWRGNKVQLLLQVHDAIVIQYPAELENELVPWVMKTLELDIPLMYDRTLRIPTEAFVGWNWDYAYNDKKELVNPNGLVPYTGTDLRKRQAKVPLMDRKFSSLY